VALEFSAEHFGRERGVRWDAVASLLTLRQAENGDRLRESLRARFQVGSANITVHKAEFAMPRIVQGLHNHVDCVGVVHIAAVEGKVIVHGVEKNDRQLTRFKNADFILQDFGGEDNCALDAVSGKNPYLIGQMSMEFGAKMVKGEEVPEYSSVSVLPLNRLSPSGINTFEADLKAILER